MITASIKTRANEVIVIIRRYNKHPYWTSQNELWYSSWTEIEMSLTVVMILTFVGTMTVRGR